MSNIKIGLTLGSGGGCGFKNDPITKAYFNGMANAVPADFKKLYDTYLVKNKKTVNGTVITFKQLLALMDVFYTPVINNTNDSFRNLAKNAHHGTIQGSGLVFDPYWGWTNPAGTGYVDTNFNPNTQGVKNTLNDAGVCGGFFGILDVGRYLIYSYDGNNYSGIASEFNTINSGGSGATRPVFPFHSGLHFIRRTASNALAALNQNISNSTATTVSSAKPNAKYFLWQYSATAPAGGHYLGGINFVGIGASLTDDQFTALNLIVNEFLIQCLYYKYGKDNWGVKMAKSYFDTLHNFEPYEAWEVYEFIKRMQSDYVDGAGTGYYYNTFGPSGQNKTVADFIMLFKAGGNLAANAWTKTGALLRWSQDGSIAASNTMPAYTRGTNLGIVTVTSTDGFNLITDVVLNQATNSVNSFYGNFPIITSIKTNTNKILLTIHQNRFKLQLNLFDFAGGVRGISANSVSFPGYLKMAISKLVGGSYSKDITISGYGINSLSLVNGDVTTLTNIMAGGGQLYLSNDFNIIGTLANLSLPNTLLYLQFSLTGMTGGTSTWNRLIQSLIATGSYWTSQAILNQLQVQKDQFTLTPPVNNLSENFSGGTMGIVASNHQLILDITAQHVAVGKTFTCTTRTL